MLAKGIASIAEANINRPANAALIKVLGKLNSKGSRLFYTENIFTIDIILYYKDKVYY